MKYHYMRTPKKAAFSILEVMVACGMLAVAAAAAVGTLTRMNYHASLARLQTGASTVAQERIDRVLEDGPFNPKKNQVPPFLAIPSGTTATQTVGTESNPTIPIYTDPDTNEVVVAGWLTSTITKTTQTYGPWEMEMRYVDVTVNYKYRGKSYSIRMSTVRSPDA